MVVVPSGASVTGKARFRPAAIGVLALTVLAGCGSTGVVTIGPGESLNAAAKRAGRDGIVKLEAGTYPAQTVNTGTMGDCYTQRATAQTRDCRTFLVPQGAKVRMGNLRIEGSGTALLAQRGDLTIDGLYTLGPSSENVVRGAVIDPADGDPGIYLGQASRWAIYDSEVKGVTDNDGVDIYGGNAGGSDVLLDGLAVHDVHITPASCQHTDGVQVAGTTGPPQNAVTITNSHVYDVDQNADIQLDSTPEGRGAGHVIAGNTLDTVRYVATSCVPTPYPRSVTLSGNQIRVENNVAAQPFFVYPGSGSVTANRAPAPQFSGGASCSTYLFSANVWSANPYGTRCP